MIFVVPSIHRLMIHKEEKIELETLYFTLNFLDKIEVHIHTYDSKNLYKKQLSALKKLIHKCVTFHPFFNKL